MNDCPDCALPMNFCDCESEFITVKIPYCPQCHEETGVYCMECSYDFLSCDCVDESSSWYCMKCDCEFEYDILDFSEHDTTVETYRSFWQDPQDLRWYWDDGSEVKCYCYSPKRIVCSACGVSRDSPTDIWAPWIDVTIENKAKETQTTQPASGGYSTAWGNWSTTAHLELCKHRVQEVRLNTVTIHASSLFDTRTDLIPDWGLYADWLWTPWWRNEHIDWRDYGLPTDFDTAAEQITHAYDLAKQGKIVEIGCIGGHGRTGTILCCMAILDGMTSKEAIPHIENIYCQKVVETWEQKWWIEWFEASLHGMPEPKKPERPAPQVIIPTTTTYTQMCSSTHHLVMLRAGATGCKYSQCKTFEHDLQRYLRGLDKGYTRTISEIADDIIQNRK